MKQIVQLVLNRKKGKQKQPMTLFVIITIMIINQDDSFWKKYFGERIRFGDVYYQYRRDILRMLGINVRNFCRMF